MRDRTDTMHDGGDTSDASFAPLGDALTRWSHSPTVKQRTAVRHELNRLFEDLAPERRPPRGAVKAPARVEQHRSPRGCILQAVGSAVSVSWFAAADTDMALGELVVSVWRGIVSHPGSARRARDGAVMLHELTLRPVEVAPDAWRWRATDDALYDTGALAEWCRDQLEQQLLSTDGADRAAVPA